MEDREKVENKLRGLGIDWIAADGYHALTRSSGDLIKGENVIFNPGAGIPIKVFMNKVTGDVKIFPAILFEKNE